MLWCSGDFVRLGICYPVDVESLVLSTRNVLPSTDPAVEVANIEELDASTNPKAFFRDKSLGFVYNHRNSLMELLKFIFSNHEQQKHLLRTQKSLWVVLFLLLFCTFFLFYNYCVPR